MPRTVPGRQTPCIIRLGSEREIQSGGQDNVIFLEGRRGRRRIGHVDFTERILPSQPLAQLGDAAEVEGYAILPSVAEVGEQVQLLSK
jgi:hypothetical protein